MDDDMMKNKKIGSRIREARIKKGFSVEELGNKIFKSRATIYRWEDGIIGGVSFLDFCMLCEALDVSLAYLMGWSADNTNESIIKNSDISYRIDAPDKPALDIIIDKLPELNEGQLKRLTNYVNALYSLKHDD